MADNAKIDIQACRELRNQEETLINQIRTEIHQDEPNEIEKRIFASPCPESLIHKRLDSLNEKYADSLSRKQLVFTYKKHLETFT